MSGYKTLLVMLLSLASHCVGHQQLEKAATHIVHPIVQHARTKRELSSTRDINGEHYSEVHLTMSVEGAPWLLELALNERLVPEGHTLQYQEEGKTVQNTPMREELDLCHYTGTVRGKPQSWVAVSTCRGVQGVIFDGRKIRHIEPVQGIDIRSPHYFFEHSNINPVLDNFLGVVADNYTYDHELTAPPRERRDEYNANQNKQFKRSIRKSVRETYKANERVRYVEMVLIADHSVYLAHGNTGAVHSNMIQVANILFSIYSLVNIYISLVGVVVWKERDEIYIDRSMDQTLTNLQYYRKELVTKISNDNSPLVTLRSFEEQNIEGMGYVDSMCSSYRSTSVNFMVSVNYVAFIIAHEMAHNLGLNHEDETCKCQSKECTMDGKPKTSLGRGPWTQCSLKSLELILQREKFLCLNDVPEGLSPTCGDGFVEPGEQCDCGPSNTARSTCGACCDFKTCRFKPASVKCRSEQHACDLPEYCTGLSEFCPQDVFKMDSTPCGTRRNQVCLKHKCVRAKKYIKHPRLYEMLRTWNQQL